MKIRLKNTVPGTVEFKKSRNDSVSEAGSPARSRRKPASRLSPQRHPITIILTGILCALPTLLLRNRDQWTRETFALRIALHALALYAVILGMGWLFQWYTDAAGCFGVSVVFFLVYGFVWLSSHWLDKQDEKKINQALEGIRDLE